MFGQDLRVVCNRRNTAGYSRIQFLQSCKGKDILCVGIQILLDTEYLIIGFFYTSTLITQQVKHDNNMLVIRMLGRALCYHPSNYFIIPNLKILSPT